MKIRIAAAAAVIGCWAVAGCGISAAHTAATSAAAQTAAPAAAQSAALSTCTIYAQQHDAQIVISPGDQAECNELIKDMAGGDAFWSYTPNGQAVANLQQACDMTSPNGTYEAVVLDDSGGFIGQDVCSGMASSGWTTSQAPGPLAQQIAQEAGQQQQAQASASAAAATQQQISSLQASLQSDVSTLAQDAASLDNDNSLAGDVKSMKNDLGTEQTDYATVQNDTCSNAGGARETDAATVDTDAATVDTDLATVQTDITGLQDNNQVSNDISKVQTDVSQLRSLSASPATDPTAAIAAGNKALKDMNAAIAWANQQGSVIDGQAHQIAKAADALANEC
jgi:hypothetical protein